MLESTGTKEGKYECKKCRDVGQIIVSNDKGQDVCQPCECAERKEYKRILETSGISESFMKKTFHNYIANNLQRKDIKNRAMEYAKEFDKLSFLALGQVGAGKTHITIAIANALMKQNIPVLYAQYSRMVNELLSARNDELNYNKVADKYRNARVLLIDDLFKGAVNEWNDKRTIIVKHIEIVFDIINYRYLNEKPILISSELDPNALLDLDEGIASRLLEMAGKNIVCINGTEMNYRIFKAG